MVSIPAFLLAIAVRAPLGHPWTSLDGSEEMVSSITQLLTVFDPLTTVLKFKHWMVIELLGLAIDFSILAFSVIIVWLLQMSVWKRLTVCTLFAVRML